MTIDNKNEIKAMTKTYMTLQNALDDKDSEISRLKDGYDTEIYSKFLSRFIRIDQTIDDCIIDNEFNKQSFDLLKRLMEDAIEECNVEIFKPVIGKDYRDAFGVADNPKIIKTKKSNEDFLVAEVLEAGYKLRTAGEYKVLVPSKVTVFRNEE